MAMNRTAVLIIGTLAVGHLSYHVLKPLFIPPSSNSLVKSVPDKPIFWEPASAESNNNNNPGDIKQ